MSTLPRTPRYFPKMKVRGKQRHRLAPWQRLAGAFDRTSVSFAEFARVATQFGEHTMKENNAQAD